MRHNRIYFFKATDEFIADTELFAKMIRVYALQQVRGFRIIGNIIVGMHQQYDDFVRNMHTVTISMLAYEIPRFVTQQYNRNANRNNRIQRRSLSRTAKPG